MVRVCANYCGTHIVLGEFETWQEAEEFMKRDVVLATEDETEDGTPDIIFSDEMFIEDEVPFCEPFPDLDQNDFPF